MNQRRSIQDIIPPARSKPIRQSAHNQDTQTKGAAGSASKLPPRRPKEGGGIAGLLGIALGVIAVIGIAFGIASTVFHRAEAQITLHEFRVAVAETFTASPDGVLLSFSERSAEVLQTASVPQSGSEYVEERSSGTIAVFNEFSSAPQRLITNTRFETPQGLVYRIKSPIVVPGYTKKDGKVVPGTINATVFADEPGERYNIAASDFTIPGLKGSPQYESMFARSSAAFSGGFVGERAIVEASVRDTAVAALKGTAEAAAREKLLAERANGELVFTETVRIAFVEQPDKAGANGAEVSVLARATAPVFEEDRLARVIAGEGGITYESPLRIANANELLIQVAPSEGSPENVDVTISGDALLVGAYDQERLLNDLAGKDRRSVGVVLSGYPAISDMRIAVYPFWRGVLPEDPNRITVRVEDAALGASRD